MNKKRPELTAPTALEDDALTAAALNDPDNLPLDDAQLAALRPARGRPRLAQPKVALTMRVDADVLEALKRSGPGWQTRVNSLLRNALALSAAHH